MQEPPALDRLSSSIESCPLGIQDCPVAAGFQRLKEECEALADLSEKDPLTGLFNYRHLITALDLEMERTRRTRLPTGLIMIDLDHFKRVNDTYGHQSGNDALRWAADVWRNSLRRMDIACRYGGEEFAVILPGIRLPQAIFAAERLRKALESSPVELEGEQVLLTASFGVDTYGIRDDRSVEGFIKRADRFLQDAKVKGRNRVCYEESKMERPESEVKDEERAALLLKR
jgi:diguanylate cyclase (GGDEF)-like protein